MDTKWSHSLAGPHKHERGGRARRETRTGRGAPHPSAAVGSGGWQEDHGGTWDTVHFMVCQQLCNCMVNHYPSNQVKKVPASEGHELVALTQSIAEWSYLCTVLTFQAGNVTRSIQDYGIRTHKSWNLHSRYSGTCPEFFVPVALMEGSSRDKGMTPFIILKLKRIYS